MTKTNFVFQWTSLSLVVSIIALIVAVVVSGLAIQRSSFRRSVIALELLRFAIIALCIGLLNQPETIERFKPSDKPTVAILADQSFSMDTQDVSLEGDQDSALITRRASIAPLLDRALWKLPSDAMEIVIMPFSTKAQQDRSNLSQAIQDAIGEHPRLRAIVLASDGDWNDGLPPVQAAMPLRQAKIPIFSVATGSPSRLPDLELLSFDVPTFGVAGKSVRLPFTILSALPRDHVAEVELKDSDGTIIKQSVRVGAMGRTSDAMLWKPATTGDYTVSLSIAPHPDERNRDNNQKETPISIREEKLKVLVIESYPRWEYRYLRNALSRDPGVEVSCLLFHPNLTKVGGGNRDYIRVFPETLEALAQFDVIFLGDVGVEPRQLTEEQCRLLKGLVEQQASGLVFMPGVKGYSQSLVDSPLGPLLPVVMDAAQPTGVGSSTPSHFALTELGRKSLLTKLADTGEDNLQVWENLPGFQWHAPIIRAKAGTDILAVHQESSNEYGRIPLLVTRTFGSGKILFMGTDGAWRWRRGVEDLYHYRFWSQVVRWMAYQRNMAEGESMRLYYSPEQPQVRQTLSLGANLMDKTGEPLASGEVTAKITAPSGRIETVSLSKSGDEWGAFAGSFTANEPGAHQVMLRCKESEGELKTSIFVQGATLEQVGKPARPEVLEELARVTYGKMLAAADTDAIVKAVTELPEPPIEIRRLQLWNHPLVAGMLVFLMAFFWIGRKVVGLV